MFLPAQILTDTTYVDTDVTVGTTYYYYFKVVNTDGNEEEKVSNTASAKPKDATKPVITHTPVTSGKYQKSVTVSATVTDNVSVSGVELYYRPAGAAKYNVRSMIAGDNNRYVATIPSSAMSIATVEYYIAAKDGDGNIAYSGTAQNPHRIAVADAPAIAITSHPQSVTATAGETVTFSVEGNGVGLKYQWQYKTPTGEWTNSPATGNKTATLTVPATLARNGYQYRCKVTNAAGSVTSNAATLTVQAIPKPVITSQPVSKTVGAADSVSFTVVATGEGLKYQWQYKTPTGAWTNNACTTATFS